MPTLEEIRAVEYPPILDETDITPGEGETIASEAEGADDSLASAFTPAPEVASESGETVADPSITAEAHPGVAETAPEGETPAAEDTTDVVARAAQLDQLNEMLRTNPQALIQQLIRDHMAPQDAAALVAQLAPAPVDTAPPFEAQSEGEEYLLRHTSTLEALPAWSQRVDENIQALHPYINDAVISTAALEAKVEALEAFLGVVLPKHDVAAIQKTLMGGKLSARDAIKQSYTPALTKAVEAKKQSVKPRPRTPGDQASDIPQTKSKDLAEIFRLVSGNG